MTVWLKARAVKTGAGSQGGPLRQATPEAPSSPPAAPEEPCHGSAAYPPDIERALVTPGPTELVVGFYLDGGPLVGFSAPACMRPEPPSGAGTVEVVSASGTLVATQTSEYGHLIEIPLSPGAYTITGTFVGATICSGTSGCVHPTETRSIEIRAGYTLRETLVLQIA